MRWNIILFLKLKIIISFVCFQEIQDIWFSEYQITFIPCSTIWDSISWDKWEKSHDKRILFKSPWLSYFCIRIHRMLPIIPTHFHDTRKLELFEESSEAFIICQWVDGSVISEMARRRCHSIFPVNYVVFIISFFFVSNL